MSDHPSNKPNEKEPLLLDHDYDGIQELDHFLPRWWLGILYGSMIFAVGYVAYYGFGKGESIRSELEKATAANLGLQRTQIDLTKEVTERELLAFASNPQKLKTGAAVYATRCVACHGAQGQGGIGPNLTDDYWLHGGKITDSLRIVANGVVDKGMLAWGTLLPPEEVYSVVGYLFTLKGTRPPNPKAPQGDLVKK